MKYKQLCLTPGLTYWADMQISKSLVLLWNFTVGSRRCSLCPNSSFHGNVSGLLYCY